ncbi:MAG: alanine dehydrogenase/pyridine nucleotide transhydrogenase [Caulobacteraceae bacterium]|nr:alanine dehydrogenase/pyridine nucleotide transhydrogenase [Caulobacteraceae bacterium]
MANDDLRPSIGVLAEHFPGERRVALVPADVRRLGKSATITVERGAGAEAGFPDEAYIEAGATIAHRPSIVSSAGVVVGVRAPSDLASFHPGAVVVSLGGRDAGVARAVFARELKHLALERLPRTTRAQAMDVLSSQATIAGYAAVIEGARALDVLLPMLTTAAGVVKPARMIAVGAGVAGLQAIATARRLGAVAHGFDVREAAREQVESLGARFVSPGEALKAREAANGYAADQSADEQAALRRALAPTLAHMQLIVASAQIPGRPAPLLIDDETLAGLAPGTVIVDLAAESGGNTSRTEPGETVTIGGVKIVASVNLPSQMPADASRLFSGNIRALLEHLIPDETGLQLRPDDPIIAGLLGVDQTLRAAA